MNKEIIKEIITVAKLKITNTKIEGLYVLEPTVYADARGEFFEAFNNQELTQHGLTQVFVQDNEVISGKGVLRGMHVNTNNPQGKLIRVLDGLVYDVVVDLRKNSKTFMQIFYIELSSKNRKQLYIPEGLGHGYLAIEDSRVLFKVTTHYTPNDEIGFSWKSINVDWPIGDLEIIQNERDASSPMISEIIERL